MPFVKIKFVLENISPNFYVLLYFSIYGLVFIFLRFLWIIVWFK